MAFNQLRPKLKKRVMSNDSNYTIKVSGKRETIDQLLAYLDRKKERYETWQEKVKGITGEAYVSGRNAAMKEFGLTRVCEFVTWGFFLESRKDLKRISKIVLGGWANENSWNMAISGEDGELAELYSRFPELSYAVAYSDDYSRGDCYPPAFEKEISEDEMATLNVDDLELFLEGGSDFLDMPVMDYKHLGKGSARYLSREWPKLKEPVEILDLSGILDVSAKDLKFLAKLKANVKFSESVKKLLKEAKP